MPVLYRSEDVSFSDEFYEPVTIGALSGGEGRAVLDCFGGLTRGESEKLHGTAYNQLKVQPSIAQSWLMSVAFVPSEDTVAAILKAFKANRKCHLSERTPFTQIPLPARTTYSLIIPSKSSSKDVFTRHPITRVIRRHQHPYTDLPQFTLSAHPCFMAEAGHCALWWRLAPPIFRKYLLYATVRCFCNKIPFWTKPRKSRYLPSSHSSSLQSSMLSKHSSDSQSTTSSYASAATTDASASANPTSNSTAGKRKQNKWRQEPNPARPHKIARREGEGARPLSPCGSSFKSLCSTSISHSTTTTNAIGATGKRKRDDCSRVSTLERTLSLSNKVLVCNTS